MSRRTALQALGAVLDDGAYANLALKDALRGSQRREAAFVSALVYTTLEKLSLLDYYIDAVAQGRVQKRIRNILRLGICEMLFMRTAPAVACSESVKLTKSCGKAALAAYVNAVMRTIGRMAETDTLPALPADAAESLAIRSGYPLWLVREHIGRYGADFTEAMLTCRLHGMTLRAQPPFTEAALEAFLTEKGIAWRRGELAASAFHLLDGGFAVEEEPLFREGKITVQSESAMLVCRALDPRPGERILDACAAPGGKSACIAALMGGEGRIFAWELHEHRVELMRAALERLHVSNVECACRDASRFDPACVESFDRVLLDVPCSGFGVSDKPDLRYKKTEADVEALCGVQRAILDTCAAYVKPGGQLLYATCTVSYRENEAQVLDFLKRHPAFRPVSLRPFLPESMAGGEDGMLQLFMHLHGTEGFFLARMERCL